MRFQFLPPLRRILLGLAAKTHDGACLGHFGGNATDGQDGQNLWRRFPEQSRCNVKGVQFHILLSQRLAHLRDDASKRREIAVNLR